MAIDSDLTTLIVTAAIVWQSLSIRSKERAVLPASVLRQLRALRFLQVVRMIRVDRRGSSWKLLASVLRFIFLIQLRHIDLFQNSRKRATYVDLSRLDCLNSDEERFTHISFCIGVAATCNCCNLQLLDGPQNTTHINFYMNGIVKAI